MKNDKEVRRMSHAGNLPMRFDSAAESAVMLKRGPLLFGRVLRLMCWLMMFVIVNVAFGSGADDIVGFESKILSHFNSVMLSESWSEVPFFTDQSNLVQQTHSLAAKFVQTINFTNGFYDERIKTDKACLSRLSIEDGTTRVTNIFTTWQLENLRRPVCWISCGYQSFSADSIDIDIAYDFVVANIIGKTQRLCLVKGIESVASSGDYLIKGTFSRKNYQPLSNEFYIFWIDDQPNANWRHPARCVFVDKDLSRFVVLFVNEPIAVYQNGQELPFRLFSKNEKEETLEVSIDDVRNAQNAIYTESNAISFSGDASKSYAILISGGSNIHNNHTRYWGDMSAVYSTLTKRYGIPKSNIKVCMSDGISDGVDLASGSTGYYYDAYGQKHYAKEQSHSYFTGNSSPLDLDGDNVADVEYDALKATIQSVFSEMKAKLTATDQLFVFITDHGGQDDDTGLYYLCLWNQQKMSPTEFATMTAGINCPIAFAMEFCYSGAFIPKLKAQSNRVIATAAGVETSSGFMTTPELYYMNPWVFYYVSAMRGATPSLSVHPWNNGASVSADIDGDGYVSVQEASNYANVSIGNFSFSSGGVRYTYPETPQYESSPSELGNTFFFVKKASNLVSVTPSVASYTSASVNGSFSVKADSSWTVTKSASATWITLNKTKGSGNETVSYSVEANNTGTERRGIITVTSGSETATHEVIQSAETAKLWVNPPTSDVSNAAESGSFSVEANYLWTVSTTTSWIHLITTSGSGNDTVSYSVDENTGAQRSGTITVTSGSLTATHTVTQAAKPQLSIDPEAKTFSAAAGNGTIRITSDSMWTVSKSATWITLGTTTSGTGNGTIGYAVSENTGSQRQGWIYVSCGSVRRTLLVTQNRSDSVTFSAESANVSEDGGTGSFTVTILGNNRAITTTASTVPWVSWTWATENISEGIRYTFTYKVEPNTTIQTRSATIPIDFNGTVYKFTITQSPSANNYVVTYRPGANGTGSETYAVKRKNVSLTLKGAIFSQSGFMQKGWATSEGGAKVYDLNASYTANSSVVLYPYWEPSSSGSTTYNVYLNPGAYGEGTVQTLTKYKGVALTLPGAIYERSGGYEQTGWSARRAGDTKAYELGGKYTADATTYLYPYWEEKATDPVAYDIGFYAPSGWGQPMCLSTTNIAAGVYAPQYVFGQDDGFVLNYCVGNYSGTEVTFDDRHVSLWDGEINMIESQLESEARTISKDSYMRFRNRDFSSWLSSLVPGNYAMMVYLDPNNKLNDPNDSDNACAIWFAVKASGITPNEALDCNSLYFTDNGSDAFVQTAESVVGGSCVQFGPQQTNTFGNAVMWAYVDGPGTLSFKWKAVADDDEACMVFYDGAEMKKYVWGGNGDWSEVSVEVTGEAHWVRWELWTYDVAPSSLAAGWLDNVVWNSNGWKPTFTVDSRGTLTGVELNGVTDLEIPSMVNSIAVRSIGACVLTNTPITSLSLPNTVTNIGRFAFYDNRSLTGVTIPGSVVSIEESAFNACSSLKSVVLSEGVRNIGNYAFYNCGSLSIVGLPASATNIGQSPFGKCRSLHAISVASGNSYYAVENNALIDVSSRTLIQYPSGRSESEYEVPMGLCEIGYDAFDNVVSLTKVVLPESLTRLGSFAFFQCSNLVTLTFKGDAVTVGDYAFHGVQSSCKALVSPQSSGWGVSIPGTWQGIRIEYSAALQTYAVTYKPGSYGTGSQLSEVKSHGITLPLKGATFTRIGYAQTGWSTSDGGAKAYELGASYTANATVTLYPYWTANTYTMTYELDGGTIGATCPASAIYGTAFRVSAPSRNGHVFAGWMVTSGLDVSTARYGESSSSQSTDIDNASLQCFNGSDVDVWFINLTPQPSSVVVLTATWEPVVDDSRDIGFYAPASQGWSLPVCLSSTNIEYLAYAPETEFVQGIGIYLSFCAVNWSTVGPAILQSTLLTITDEVGTLVDEGEPIQRCPVGTFGYHEFRNIDLSRYLAGVAPGRYKLTAELDPNRILNDPDRSNNTTSIWFTITASSDPTYAVTYKPGSYASGSTYAATKTNDVALVLRGVTYTRTGYTQTGWSTSSTGASKSYSLSVSYTANSAITLYPYWTPNTYSVAYALNGGTHGTTHPSSATYDTAFCVSAPARSGYTFTGWTVTSGLNTSTAKWGATSSPSTSLTSSTTKCVNGATGNVYFKNLHSSTGSVTLTANWAENAVALSTALDNTTLTFTTGGASSWFGQSVTAHDGVDAARSGALGNSQTNWLQTTVSGLGTISFWWYASSEQNCDILEFLIDGSVVGSTSGTNNVWAGKSFTISTSGTHILQWRYRKDGSQYRGEDAGFVDQVEWTPSGVVVDVGRGETVTVPGMWIEAHRSFLATTGLSDEEAVRHGTAMNGRKIWECYVLGLDPGDATSDFRIVSFPMKADGSPDLANIEYEPARDWWNVPEARAVIRGAATLEGPWRTVPAGGDSSMRFFKAVILFDDDDASGDSHVKVQLWEGGPYWATTNIGAERPEDYGYYFCWGDTVGYKREGYSWVASDGSSANFSFDAGNTPTYGKSVATLQSEGWITSDGVLAPAHDAAHAHWGGDWRMPTYQELSDLIGNCDWTWTTQGGVNGYIVRGRGDYASASIFLPAADYGYGTSLYNSGSGGFYWSSVPRSDSSYSRYLYFDSGDHNTGFSSRYYGQSVRPVQGFAE